MKYFILKKNVLQNTVIFALIIVLLVYNEGIFLTTKNTIKLFIESVFPSIFPFLLLTTYLIISNKIYTLTLGLQHIVNKIFNISLVATPCLLIGYLFGYPNSARFLTNLYQHKYIKETEYLRLVCLVCNANPVYIFTYIGIGIVNDSNIAIILFISHILSSVILLIATRNTHTTSTNIIYQDGKISNTFDTILKSIRQSLTIVANIFTFNILFSVIPIIILNALESLHIALNTTLSAILYAICEISSGMEMLQLLDISQTLKICLMSFAISFSSLMIVFQVAFTCINPSKTLKCLMLSKFIQGIISATITYILLLIK